MSKVLALTPFPETSAACRRDEFKSLRRSADSSRSMVDGIQIVAFEGQIGEHGVPCHSTLTVGRFESGYYKLSFLEPFNNRGSILDPRKRTGETQFREVVSGGGATFLQNEYPAFENALALACTREFLYYFHATAEDLRDHGFIVEETPGVGCVVIGEEENIGKLCEGLTTIIVGDLVGKVKRFLNQETNPYVSKLWVNQILELVENGLACTNKKEQRLQLYFLDFVARKHEGRDDIIEKTIRLLGSEFEGWTRDEILKAVDHIEGVLKAPEKLP